MPDGPSLPVTDDALLRLLERLDTDGYDFITATPLTHERVLRRDPRPARDLRDVLGWSRPFEPEVLDPQLFRLLDQAGVLQPEGSRLKATVRVSRVHGLLFLHSAFPTTAEDSVFLGPDSYRFADFVAGELGSRSWLGRVADIGGGAGVGALTTAAGRTTRRLVLTDVNPKALRLARLNALHAGIALETVEAPDLEGAPDACDLILANPPYIVDEAGRAYRDGGGGLHGGQASLDWAHAAIPKLAPGGRFLLYTGAAIVEGANPLRAALAEAASVAGCAFSCRELDPDVFGEELEKPAYRDVERIAVIGAAITKPRAAPEQN